MVTFRDLIPAERPEEELALPRSARINGETVEEAIARGVRIQFVPIIRRAIDEGQRPRWGCDGFVSGRSRQRPGPKVQEAGAPQHG